MQPYTLHPAPCTLHPTPYTIHPTPYTLNRSESAQNTDSTQAIDSGCFAARPDTHSISPPPPHHTPATAALPRTGIARVAGRVHHLPHRLPLVSSCAPRVSEGLVTCTPPRPAAPSPISAYAITSPDQPITHNPPIPNPETLKPAPRAATGVPQIDPPPPHPHRSPTRLYQRLTNEGPVATTAACRGSFTLLLLVKDPLLPLSARKHGSKQLSLTLPHHPRLPVGLARLLQRLGPRELVKLHTIPSIRATLVSGGPSGSTQTYHTIHEQCCPTSTASPRRERPGGSYAASCSGSFVVIMALFVSIERFCSALLQGSLATPAARPWCER